MDEKVDAHIRKRYDLKERLGKGVRAHCSAASLPSFADTIPVFVRSAAG